MHLNLVCAPNVSLLLAVNSLDLCWLCEQFLNSVVAWRQGQNLVTPHTPSCYFPPGLLLPLLLQNIGMIQLLRLYARLWCINCCIKFSYLPALIYQYLHCDCMRNVIVLCFAGLTSVSTVISTAPLHSQSSQQSSSFSSPVPTHSFTSVAVTAPVSSLSTVSSKLSAAEGIPQSHGSCSVGPVAESTSVGGPVMHYGSAPAHGYSQMIAVQTSLPRMMGQPLNVPSPYYHPSADFQATMPAAPYQQTVPFAAHQMPYTRSAGYTVYDRNAMYMTPGSTWSENVQPQTQLGGVRGCPLAQSVSTTATLTSVNLPSDASELVRAPTKSRRKSRAQSVKESYSSILERNMPCPNIDVRQIIQEQRERLQMEVASCSSISAHTSTAVWTMPMSTVHAVSQHSVTASSPNLPTMTSSLSKPPSIDDRAAITSSSSVFASSEEVSRASLGIATTTTSESVSSQQQTSSVDAITKGLHAVASASISPATSTTDTVSVSTAVLVTATSLSCGPSWLYTAGTQWPPVYSGSNHPLSSVFTTKPFTGMSSHQYDCLQSHQVSNVQPCQVPPVLRPNFPTGGMLVPSVTVTPSVVGSNSACLPEALQQSLSSGEETTGATESPIRLVQNMVSGLKTTQNSLAMATSLIISQSDPIPRRRRSSVAAEHTATSSAAATQLHDAGTVGSNNESSPDLSDSSFSVHLPADDDSLRCTTVQSKLHLLSSANAATTVTSVLTQVLPAASVIPSAYCMHSLPSATSASIHPLISPATPSLCSDMVSITTTLSTGDVKSIAVSCSGDADMDSTCYSARGTVCSTGSGTVQQTTLNAVVDDDESTQDCDMSLTGTDSGEVLCTTGTQTSTPASAMSNCNSMESGADGSESSDAGGLVVSTADDAGTESQQSDEAACNLFALKPPSVEKPPADDVHPEHVLPTSTSTPVVLIPRVPQASFFLPQNIAFTPNPLVGHGFLQFQPPRGEFGYGASVQSSGAAVGQPSALGLVHFAAGPMVGPAVGSMMATSDASSFRLMAPAVKSDGEVYSAAGAAEFLPLMSAAVPTGHILLQNIVPTGLAVPFMQPAALCSLPGGSSAVFAVSQGSMMSVGAPLAFAASMPPVHHRPPHDHHAPDQPDSTVDNSEMDTTDEPSSDDSIDTVEQVTSTDEPLDDVSDSLTDSAVSATVTIHCSTGYSTCLSMTKTVQGCSTTQHNVSNTSNRTEHGDDVSSDVPCATSHFKGALRSLSLAKKRSRLGQSRLKNLHRRGYSRSVQQRSSTVDQRMACSSTQPRVPEMAGMTSLEIDSLSPRFHGVKDMAGIATSDSSVSTTLSLPDVSADADFDPGTGENRSHWRHHAGTVQKPPRWKKQALARRTRLKLRHAKLEAKPTVDEPPSSPAETVCAGE